MQSITQTSASNIRKLVTSPILNSIGAARPRIRLLAIAATALLGWNSNLRADEQIPFRGEFSFVVSNAYPIDSELRFWQFEAAVTARATLLGNAHGPARWIFDSVGLSYAGEAVWAGANGDAVFVSFAGQFVPSDTPGILNNVETTLYTGGTGRFTGATGVGYAGGQVGADLMPLGTAPFDGMLSSPGSLK